MTFRLWFPSRVDVGEVTSRRFGFRNDPCRKGSFSFTLFSFKCADILIPEHWNWAQRPVLVQIVICSGSHGNLMPGALSISSLLRGRGLVKWQGFLTPIHSLLCLFSPHKQKELRQQFIFFWSCAKWHRWLYVISVFGVVCVCVFFILLQFSPCRKHFSLFCWSSTTQFVTISFLEKLLEEWSVCVEYGPVSL